jgi:NAD(P)-dependent dehydrogenase (short-subunit alcohol dehydrogenase family)
MCRDAQRTMHGKHVLITGPTSGIGFQIAVELAILGARLTLACRDVARGRRAEDAIRHASGTAARIAIAQVDTSSTSSIRAFAQAFRDSGERLDVLVNNAGISQGERNVASRGLELTFATNVLGYFTLTNELLDVLRRSAPARIVNVASRFAGHLDLADLQFERRAFDGLAAYAQSKACNRLLTWALARRIAGSGVTANAYAPGFVPGTALSRDLPADVRAAYSVREGRTTHEGADTAVWLASAPEVAGASGKFFMDRREVPCELRDEAIEERLWTECERLAGQ